MFFPAVIIDSDLMWPFCKTIKQSFLIWALVPRTLFNTKWHWLAFLWEKCCSAVFFLKFYVTVIQLLCSHINECMKEQCCQVPKNYTCVKVKELYIIYTNTTWVKYPVLSVLTYQRYKNVNYLHIFTCTVIIHTIYIFLIIGISFFLSD